MPYSYEKRYRLAMQVIDEQDDEIKALWSALVSACDGDVYKAQLFKAMMEERLRASAKG